MIQLNLSLAELDLLRGCIQATQDDLGYEFCKSQNNHDELTNLAAKLNQALVDSNARAELSKIMKGKFDGRSKV